MPSENLTPQNNNNQEISKAEVIQLSPDQWELFRDIKLKALKDCPEAFKDKYEDEVNLSEEDWRKKLSDIKKQYFFSEKDKKIIAMIGIEFLEGVDKQKVEIHSVFVERDRRYKGVGTALMKDILEKIKTNPEITEVVLKVRATQEDAIKIYKKLGFEVYEDEKMEGKEDKVKLKDGSFVDRISMKLTLNNLN